MAGGGGAASIGAFNELRDNLTPDAGREFSYNRLERAVEVSDVNAQRAKSDKDEKKWGSIYMYTQMRILEEALYGLEECGRLVEQCVEGDDTNHIVNMFQHCSICFNDVSLGKF